MDAAAQNDRPLSGLGRALGLGLLAAGAAVALAFAAAAAIVIGLMVAGAALALRFFPRQASAQAGPHVLDARQTPAGWVVETGAKRKS
ncbi:MAG: hypothetical protein AB7P07_01355 [Hyphomonadaceae bacterium]